MSNFSDVGDFHKKFDLPRVNEYEEYGMSLDAEPREWNEDLIRFRLQFMLEELNEFHTGTQTQDHSEMADALIDLVYVAMGTAHLLGYPWQELWSEVQRANMEKERAKPDGSDSKRHSKWDVVKPPGWKPPDVAGVLRAHGFNV